MTIEDHLRRMIGDLVLTTARLAAEVDRLTERLTVLETLPPLPKTPDNEGAPIP